MLIKKSQIPIFILSLVYILIFVFVFLSRQNYEFVLYSGVIIFFFILILFTNNKVHYPDFVLWGLSIWGFLHVSGGGILFKDGSRLYELILVNISEYYSVFRYDQFVHILGFFVATLVVYVLLKPLLKVNLKKWTTLSIVVIMAGFGLGALNEVIEFLATVITPQTGVGGYINTLLDLVSNLIGAILAMVYIRLRKGEI
jgi:putative membrane protein